ncbi:MAG: hypothetical protein QOJ99_4601 [Bryobacterales bacterium]|jgi:hypothetical protein|nr:hypothetical protein [Bryobacterales bacterium]
MIAVVINERVSGMFGTLSRKFNSRFDLKVPSVRYPPHGRREVYGGCGVGG